MKRLLIGLMLLPWTGLSQGIAVRSNNGYATNLTLVGTTFMGDVFRWGSTPDFLHSDGTASFSQGQVTIDAFGDVSGAFIGDGHLLNALNATQLTSGSVPAARFGSLTVPLSALAQGSAVSGQVVEWNGSAWVATDVQGVTIPNTFTQTNLVANQLYTNTSGSVQMIIGEVALVTAAGVSGRASFDVMVDQAGGTTYARYTVAAVQTTALTLAQNYTNSFATAISNSAAFYLTNSSAGSGDSATLVSGQCQLLTLSDGAAAGVATLSGNNVFTSSNEFSSNVHISGTLSNTGTANFGSTVDVYSNLTLHTSGNATLASQSGPLILSPATAFTTNQGTFVATTTNQGVEVVATTGITLAGTRKTSWPVDTYILSGAAGQNGSIASTTTYYLGWGNNTLSSFSTEGRYDLIIPVTGTLTSYTIAMFGSGGGSETVTNALDYDSGTIVTGSTTNFAYQTFPVRVQVSGLSQAVTAGHHIALRVQTPTWGSAPTSFAIKWDGVITIP